MGTIINKVVTKKTELVKKEKKYPYYIIDNMGDYDDKLIYKSDDLEDLMKTNESVFDFDEEDTCFEIEVQTSNNNSKNMTFLVTQQKYCCGISEIGDLHVDKLFSINELTKILDAWVKVIKGRTFILHTNNKDDSIIFEKALVNCERWVLVKTFKNKNSSNIIKMWISNND